MQRLELRFRRGEKMGFEGNMWCALEHNQQIGQESGSQCISLWTNRKKYTLIKNKKKIRGGGL
jgi:hypothetical protein